VRARLCGGILRKEGEDIPMRLSIKALTHACAIVWGRVVFLSAVASLLWPPSGAAFPGLVISIYPGYKTVANLDNVIVKTLYALVDGSIGGAVFTSIYNQIAK
jgi:hypothetical protein